MTAAQRSRLVDFIGMLALFMIVLVGIAGVTGALTGGKRDGLTWGQRDAEEIAKRDAFFSECIERHPESRCKEFWRYNRPDLGRK